MAPHRRGQGDECDDATPAKSGAYAARARRFAQAHRLLREYKRLRAAEHRLLVQYGASVGAVLNANSELEALHRLLEGASQAIGADAAALERAGVLVPIRPPARRRPRRAA